MRQIVLGTALGRLAMKVRDRIEIVKVVLFKEESAGTITNDWMASYLVTKMCQPNRSFIDVGAHIDSIIEGFSESHIYPRRTTNYFAAPIERRVEIRDLTRKILNIN